MTSIRVWGYRIPKLRERVLYMYLWRSFFTIIIDRIDRYQSKQANTAFTHRRMAQRLQVLEDRTDPIPSTPHPQVQIPGSSLLLFIIQKNYLKQTIFENHTLWFHKTFVFEKLHKTNNFNHFMILNHISLYRYDLH